MRVILPATALALLAACGGGGGGGTTTGSKPATCVPAVRNPSAALLSASDLVVRDLGEFDVNQLVTFSVPAGSTTFSIVSQEVNGSAVDNVSVTGVGTLPNTVVPDQVKTPGGVLYYDDINLNQPDVVYYGVSPVSGTFTAPNTSAGLAAVQSTGSLPSGTWSFLANDWANECNKVGTSLCSVIPSNTGRYHLWSVTKNGPMGSAGTLDVEVYLLLDGADGVGTTALVVAANAQVQRWVSSLGYFLSNGGISLGTVTFHDLPGAVHQQYPNNSVDITGEGPCDPLAQLFTASSASARGVNLFLIHELIDNSAGQGGNITVGIDGTIPGPSGFPGTVASGAAVGIFQEFGVESTPGACATSTPSLLCGTDRVAYIAAHEIGHWLGLYHVTESDGTLFDPLTDTSQCACSSCAPSAQRASCAAGSVQMLVNWCETPTCGGGDNLMFWLLDPSYSQGTLSHDQGQVIRLNPAVR